MPDDKRDPIQSQLDEANPADLALELIESAYGRPHHVVDAAWRVAIHTPGLDDACLVAEIRGVVWIVFAGTRNVRQWVSNFRADLVDSGHGCRVHRGFHSAFQNFHQPLHQALADHGVLLHQEGGKPVRIAGHSRGAAFALLTALGNGQWLNIEALYLFGCPRTGDSSLTWQLARAIRGRVLNFQNNNDPVPHLPPFWRGYLHVGELRYIDRRGWVHRHYALGKRILDKLLGRLESRGDGKPDGWRDHLDYLNVIGAWRQRLARLNNMRVQLAPANSEGSA